MKKGMAMVAAKFAVAYVLLPVGLAAVVHTEASPNKSPLRKQAQSGHEPRKVLAVNVQDDKIHLKDLDLEDVKSKSKRSRTRHGLRDDVPEQLETWQDSGLAVQSMLAVGDIAKLSQGITAAAFEAQLHAIVDPEPTRFLAFKGNRVAQENILKAFQSMGLQAEVQPLGASESLSKYGIPEAKQRALAGNVMGYLKGTDRANEVVIVGCHYDSVNWEDISGPAPGVDDNGSGVALMLLLAKALTQGATKPRRSILFVSFQAEEEGLVGSKKFATMFQPGAAGFTKFGHPVAALIADEVAWPGKAADMRKIIFETKGRGKGTDAVVDTLAHAAQQQCGAGFTDCVNGFVVNYHGFGSDHIPLLDVGIPAVLLIERDNMYHADTWGHSAEDNFKHVDPAYGAAMSRLSLQALVALANPTTQ